MNRQPTLILIAGRRHDRSAGAQVQARLAAAGARSHALTVRATSAVASGLIEPLLAKLPI